MKDYVNTYMEVKGSNITQLLLLLLKCVLKALPDSSETNVKALL